MQIARGELLLRSAVSGKSTSGKSNTSAIMHNKAKTVHEVSGLKMDQRTGGAPVISRVTDGSREAAFCASDGSMNISL